MGHRSLNFASSLNFHSDYPMFLVYDRGKQRNIWFGRFQNDQLNFHIKNMLSYFLIRKFKMPINLSAGVTKLQTGAHLPKIIMSRYSSLNTLIETHFTLATVFFWQVSPPVNFNKANCHHLMHHSDTFYVLLVCMHFYSGDCSWREPFHNTVCVYVNVIL